MSERKNTVEKQHGRTHTLLTGDATAEPIGLNEPRDVARRLLRTNRRRQVVGVVLTAAGISILLLVAVGLVEQFEFVDMTSLPVVGVLLLAGLLTAGCGFGLMISAAPGFDDDEFDRFLSGEQVHFSADEPDRRYETDDRPADSRIGPQPAPQDVKPTAEEQLVDS